MRAVDGQSDSGQLFFFQAEDGIRDRIVTGVQTWALPIYQREVVERGGRHRHAPDLDRLEYGVGVERAGAAHVDADLLEPRDPHLGGELAGDGPARLAVAHGSQLGVRSEEGRVGERCRTRG